LDLILRSWRWRRYIPPKRQFIFNGLHGDMSQKIGVYCCEGCSLHSTGTSTSRITNCTEHRFERILTMVYTVSGHQTMDEVQNKPKEVLHWTYLRERQLQPLTGYSNNRTTLDAYGEIYIVVFSLKKWKEIWNIWIITHVNEKKNYLF
jgi:hypothetical protein